jgi:hypothetical protein
VIGAPDRAFIAYCVSCFPFPGSLFPDEGFFFPGEFFFTCLDFAGISNQQVSPN